MRKLMFLVAIGLATSFIVFVAGFAAFATRLVPYLNEVDIISYFAAFSISSLIAAFSGIVIVFILRNRI